MFKFDAFIYTIDTPITVSILESFHMGLPSLVQNLNLRI